MKAEITYKIRLFDDSDNLLSTEPKTDDVIEKTLAGEFASPIKIKVAPGATNLAQSLANVDYADLLVIETSETISVKLNANDAPAIIIKADKISGTKKRGILLLTTEDVETLFISNGTQNVAEVAMIFAY